MVTVRCSPLLLFVCSTNTSPGVQRDHCSSLRADGEWISLRRGAWSGAWHVGPCSMAPARSDRTRCGSSSSRGRGKRVLLWKTCRMLRATLILVPHGATIGVGIHSTAMRPMPSPPGLMVSMSHQKRARWVVARLPGYGIFGLHATVNAPADTSFPPHSARPGFQAALPTCSSPRWCQRRPHAGTRSPPVRA